MKTYRIIFAFVCLTAFVIANDSMQKADKLYQKGEYYKALEEYKAINKPAAADTLALRIKTARAYYMLNKMEEAYRTFHDIADTLKGYDIYMYASALNKIGNYKEAIKWYYNVPKSLEDSLDINGKIKSCRWAMKTITSKPLELKLTRLADLGQSFGIQYYQNGVVFSSPDASKNKNKKDYHGYSFQNLFYSDLTDNQIAASQKKFSNNLEFPYHVGAISFSHNYTKMYYTKTIKIGWKRSVLKIYVSTYDEKSKDWINETELPFNNKMFNCAHPAISADGKYLYFTSDKPGGIGGKDIYRSIINEDFTFGPMENIGKPVNTIGDEMFPFIDKENNLFFSSNMHDGYGGLDVFKATLSNDKYDNIENMLLPINSSFDDFAYIVNPNDENTGFLSSDRGNKTDNIFAFKVVKRNPIKFASVIENAAEGYPVANTEISLVDVIRNLTIGVDTTDKFGAFEITIPEEYRDNGKQLAVYIKNKEYETKSISIPPAIIQDLNTRRIPLEYKKQVFPKSLSANLTNKKTGEAIVGQRVILRDSKTSFVIGATVSDSLGAIEISIPEPYQKSDQEFEVELPKSKNFAGEKMTISINELGLLNKKGIGMQPAKLVIPAVFISKLTMETDNSPVVGAQVSLLDANSGKTIGKATTKDDGSFAIPIPEKYRNEKSVFKVVTRSIPGTVVEDLTVSITSLDDLQTTGMKVKTEVFEDNFTVRSIIKDNETAAPIANAKVIIRDRMTGNMIAETTTNADGSFAANIPAIYKKDNRQIDIETVSTDGYIDKSQSLAVDDTKKLEKGLSLQPTSGGKTLRITSRITTSFNGTPVQNATVTVSDAQTGEKLGQSTTDEEGMFEIYISDTYRGPKEFVLDVKKEAEIDPKRIVSTASDLENMRRDGITITPIFNNDVLDEINKLTVEHNRKEITKKGYATLDKLAYLLKQNPKVVIKLNGQTDIRGERNDNLVLSQEMAETAKKYLMNKGIPSANIIARGYGDRYVINKCKRGVECSLSDHQINNRVEIVVWKLLK